MVDITQAYRGIWQRACPPYTMSLGPHPVLSLAAIDEDDITALLTPLWQDHLSIFFLEAHSANNIT